MGTGYLLFRHTYMHTCYTSTHLTTDWQVGETKSTAKTGAKEDPKQVSAFACIHMHVCMYVYVFIQLCGDYLYICNSCN